MYTCHCCGGPAPKQHPDHDTGFGECSDCSAFISEHNEQEWATLESIVRRALSPKNLASFDAMTTEARRGLLLVLMDAGHIGWNINGRTA